MRAGKLLPVFALGLGMHAAHAALVISNDPNSNMQCTADSCTSLGPNAVLNAAQLSNMLDTSDVTVKTQNGATSIAVTAGFSWTSAHRLILDSRTGIGVRGTLVVAGPGGLTLTLNDGGSDSDLNFPGDGHIEFWDTTSSLVIDGESYVLKGSVAELALAIKANPTGRFALAKSYDASPDGTYKQAPVAVFSGTFEGLGNAVSNLTILDVRGKKNEINSTGLFGSSGGVIRDIDVLNARVSVGGKFENYAGGLVGFNSGTVLQAFATSNVDITRVRGGFGLGGLVGLNKGNILRSHSDSIIEEGGGLVGTNDGLISRCYSSGSINGSLEFASYGGGLVGTNGQSGTIELSHSNATVSGGFGAGGLVATNGGVVRLSFAEGHVTGSGQAGGLFGVSGGTVTDVYSTATVTGVDSGIVGGLIGFGAMTLSRSYAAGALSSVSGEFFGGVLGSDYQGSSSVANTYWDMTTTGVTDPSKGVGDVPNKSGIKGLKDKQLKAKLPDGFDPAVWGRKKSINGGLPYLLANPPAQ